MRLADIQLHRIELHIFFGFACVTDRVWTLILETMVLVVLETMVLEASVKKNHGLEKRGSERIF
jgi:uncharacterized membrane protein